MKSIIHSVVFLITARIVRNTQILNTQHFPLNFYFGVASSAYQTEGAWNKDGKGENIWDYYTHNFPDRIKDGQNGDIACDSYHKFKEDVAVLKKLGVDVYRFSLSWTRILPDGNPNNINRAGIDYYNNLINGLISKNIKPMVTLYHWDMPLELQRLGGFTNRSIIDWFEGFVRVAFNSFGDRVKIWTTFNEPKQICLFGYGAGTLAPGYNNSGIGDYLCTHHLLLAHARAYSVYVREFRSNQKGRISIVIECPWHTPKTNSKTNIEAAERQNEFDCGLYANPIYSKTGDYPKTVKTYVAKRSKAEGYANSRLPTFSKQEIIDLRGSADLFGLNYYSAYVVSHNPTPIDNRPSQQKDAEVLVTQPDIWNGTTPFKNVPWGLRKMLKWIKDKYNNCKIYITENGWPDSEPTIHDEQRINYHTWHLSNVLDAIYQDGVIVEGYTVWSLLDYFEWVNGYTIGFGLYYVNYTDPKRPRTPKDSVQFYTDVIENRKLTQQYPIN